MSLKHIKISDSVVLGNDLPFTLIAGPCQIESYDQALEIAEALSYIAQGLGVPFIYKSSFDKPNRSCINGKRGVGLAQAMPIFEDIKNQFNCPIIADVHTPDQCSKIADYVDIIQIPAFLSTQTDLIIAAAKTGKVVNVKKGQFLAPWDMDKIVKKIEDSGNNNILLTERGVSFGYTNLVADMRSIPIMSKIGYPVIFDATHSVQKSCGLSEHEGSKREDVALLARASLAVGVAGVFLETHQDPDNAPSDGSCMIHLKDMPALVSELKQIDDLVKSF